VAALLSALVGTSANAAIVSVSGNVSQVAAPSSVQANVLESSVEALVFDEQQAVSLGSSLAVDYVTATSTIGQIAAGGVVNSYFVHFDPVGTGSYNTGASQESVAGSVTFTNRILGVIWSGVDAPLAPQTPDYLDSSDSILGNAGTFYPTGEQGRGLEMDDYYLSTGTPDVFSISPDGKTLSFSLNAFPIRTDQIRVVTAVPVAPAFWLMGSGLIAVARFARKKS
jgi:hypothetical protein